MLFLRYNLLFVLVLLKESLLCCSVGVSNQRCSLLFGFCFSIIKKLIRMLEILILVQSVQADRFKVHYSIHGYGKDIVANAKTPGDARDNDRRYVPGCCSDACS
jgi:hypothetical protein